MLKQVQMTEGTRRAVALSQRAVTLNLFQGLYFLTS